MKRPVFSAILALAMISFAGWSIASKYSPRQVAAPPIEAPTNPFDHDVAGVGIVEPASEIISLAIERGGVVSRVDVVAGQTVKAGAPLFSIDRRNYEAAVAQAEASAAAQEAAIASITQNMLLQQELIRQAQANLDSAEAERTRASLDHKRYAVLVRDGSAPVQRFETAVADAKKADVSVAAAIAAS